MFSTQRSRHEASWTHDDATVKGNRLRNGWWMLLLGAVLIAGLSIYGFNRYMNVQDVTVQPRLCSKALPEEPTWADVEKAGCVPTTTEGMKLILWLDGAPQEYVVEPGRWVLEGVPVNYPALALELETEEKLGSVVVVTPEQRTVRRVLTGDAARTTWTGMLGSRAGTEQWLLLSE